MVAALTFSVCSVSSFASLFSLLFFTVATQRNSPLPSKASSFQPQPLSALWLSLPLRSSEYDVLFHAAQPAGAQLSLNRRVIGFTRAEDGGYYQAEAEGIIRRTDLATAINHHNLQFVDEKQFHNTLSADHSPGSLRTLSFQPADPTESRFRFIANTDYDVPVDAGTELHLRIGSDLRVIGFEEGFFGSQLAGVVALGDRIIGIDDVSFLQQPVWLSWHTLKAKLVKESEILCHGSAVQAETTATAADDDFNGKEFIHCREQRKQSDRGPTHIVKFRRAEPHLHLFEHAGPMTLEHQAPPVAETDSDEQWDQLDADTASKSTDTLTNEAAEVVREEDMDVAAAEQPGAGDAATMNSDEPSGASDFTLEDAAEGHLIQRERAKDRWPPWAYAFTGSRGTLIARSMSSQDNDEVEVEFMAAYFGGPFPRSRAPLLLADPPEACSALSDNNWGGAVVLVRRGSCMFHHKAQILQDVNALAMIVYNVDGSPPMRMQASPTKPGPLDLCAGMISASAATSLLKLLARQDKGSVRVRFFPPPLEDVTNWLGGTSDNSDVEGDKKVLLRVPTSAWQGSTWEDETGRIRRDRPRPEDERPPEGFPVAETTAEVTLEETTEGADVLLQSVLSKKKHKESHL